MRFVRLLACAPVMRRLCVGTGRGALQARGAFGRLAFSLAFLFLALFEVLGCGPAVTQGVGIPPVVAKPDGYTPGDVLEIRVFNEEKLSGEYQVAEDGTINFPMVGLVKVAGLTQSQVERDVQARLADGWLRAPNVSIVATTRQTREVKVLGQVKEPGSFPYRSGLTLVQALSLAGGLTDLAQAKKVRLTREAPTGTLTYDVSVPLIVAGRGKDVPLQPGDIIFVPESPI